MNAYINNRKWYFPILFFRFISKGIFIFCLFFLFSCVFKSNAYASTYCTSDSGNCYVDGVNGLDTNDGKTTTTAWKTIQKAANTVGAGDTVNVKGGITYTDLGASSCVDASGSSESTVVCIRNPGTSSSYITYKAWPGTGTPVIDATGKNQGIDIKYTASYIIVEGLEIKNAGLNVVHNNNMDCILSDYGYNILRNNIIHNCIGNGIVILDFSTGLYQIYNNTIYGNNFGISIINLITPYSGSVLIYNNILANFKVGLQKITSGPTITANYNLYYNNTTNSSGVPIGSNDIISDPLFSLISGNNFRIDSLSPVINKGMTVSNVTKDALGVLRPQGSGYDIGAYEYYDIPVNLTVTPEHYTNNSKPTFSGVASTISTGTIASISYSLDSGDWSTVGITGSNNFTITIPTSLVDGNHSIKVRAQDSYKNLTDSNLYATYSFVVDTKISEPQITDIGLIDNIPDKSSLTYYFTSTKPTVKGIADSNSNIYFLSNNKIYTTTTDTNGNYEIQIDNLVLGVNDISYYATDIAGNESTHRNLTMIIGESYFPQWLLEDLGLVTKPNEENNTNTTSNTTDNTDTTTTPVDNTKTTEVKENTTKKNPIPVWIYIVGGGIIIGCILLGIKYIKKGRE